MEYAHSHGVEWVSGLRYPVRIKGRTFRGSIFIGIESGASLKPVPVYSN